VEIAEKVGAGENMGGRNSVDKVDEEGSSEDCIPEAL
jgi:hypothetical protein